VLYRNASAFAPCSLTEGFSIVNVETMSCGVPVVATEVGPLREVGGNATELVPLGEPGIVARVLATALTPGFRREEMRRLGLGRVREFTWEAAARALAVYESIADGRKPSTSTGAA
jgi:glycosyltransferase involved in cell wall biosynthesis